jgi:hypothetical protein
MVHSPAFSGPLFFTLTSQSGYSSVHGKKISFYSGKRSFYGRKRSLCDGKTSLYAGKRSFYDGKRSLCDGKISFHAGKRSLRNNTTFPGFGASAPVPGTYTTKRRPIWLKILFLPEKLILTAGPSF